VHASPAARRRAKELGVDIAQVPPREPGKRISTDDVEEFAASAAAPNGHATTPTVAPAAPGRTIPFEGIRRVVAERLHESLQTMAQLTISREAEVAGLVARRRQLAPGFEAATGAHLTYTDLLIQEVARLLGEHALLNSTLVDGSILVSEEVHMGFAVALEDGLIVPVIRDVLRLSLGDIARERVELVVKAQAGTLTLEEIEGGTFTISNLGAFGADTFTPIINPPQCAILGIGRIVEKPVVVDGDVVVRPTMWLSLTFDHRLVDGAPAANFLQALAERIA
jgi:pyruvate dehydrogenase E2 component (dihydrolipoamide acetyltransferase)